MDKVRPLLQYQGGKCYAFEHIVKYFPKTNHLISPFIGGGSIELTLASQGVKVIAGDIWQDLIHFYKNTKEIYPIVMEYYPITNKEEFYKLRDEYKGMKDFDLKKAALFFLLNRYSYDGCLRSWSTIATVSKRLVNRLINYKFIDDIIFECMDYKDFLDKYKGFTYLDPPYFGYTDLYRGRNIDHNELASILKKRDREWVLSYNNCPEVLELYKDYRIEYPEWTYYMSLKQDRTHKRSKEVLIMNF